MKKILHRIFGGPMSYGRALSLSIFFTLCGMIIVGCFFIKVANPLESHEMKVDFMTQQEADQVQEQVEQEQQKEESASEGGTAGTKQSAVPSENNQETGSQDPNSYSENGNPNADPRTSNDPGTSSHVGPNGKPGGQGSGSGGDPHGHESGPSPSKPAHSGSFDLAGYQSALQNSLPYPSQALKLKRQGTVVYNVTFDANGTPVSATLVKSSGTSSLDNTARKHIMSHRAKNTTGSSQTRPVTLHFVLK